METRFGFKDVVVVLLLVVLLVSVWLAMHQYDRQWNQLQTISLRLEDQGRDLIAVRRAISSGSFATAPAPSSSTTTSTRRSDDPFVRIEAAKAKPGYAEGSMLIDAFGSSVGKLSPLVSSDAYAAAVQAYVLESLVDRDPDTLEWRPLLAESWKIVDRVNERQAAVDKLKGMGKTGEDIAKDTSLPPAIQVVFVMRPGTQFSDGHPLTVDDVIFTYQWIMNPQINAPRDRAYLARITKVEKTGASEVTFTFTEPYYSAFELAGGLAILPKHFYEQFKPEAFNDSVGLLMGSGPYRLADPEKWRPGDLIQLERNERYWGVGSAIDKFVWREITNDSARLASFKNGDTDLFGAAPEQFVQMIKDPAVLERNQPFEYQNPIGGYRFVAWNQSRGGKPTLFADARVRKAMTMLIDRERLINQVMLGYAVVATGPFNPLSKQNNPAVKPLPYDTDAAIALLKEAGFADRDGDGVIESADGTPFRFKLTYPSGSTNYEKQALFMKDAYARAGIAMDPDPLDWSVLVERLNKKNFEAVSLAWTAGIESDIFQMFHSSQTIEEGDNFMNYRSPRLDALLDSARRTVDEAARMKLWQEAHAVIHEDQPYTFLFFPKSLLFVDKRVNNVQKVKLGLNSRLEWFIPKEQQRTR